MVVALVVALMGVVVVVVEVGVVEVVVGWLGWCGVVKGRSQKRKIATNVGTNLWNVVVVVLRVCVCVSR